MVKFTMFYLPTPGVVPPDAAVVVSIVVPDPVVVFIVVPDPVVVDGVVVFIVVPVVVSVGPVPWRQEGGGALQLPFPVHVMTLLPIRTKPGSHEKVMLSR